jgi:tetratricopeptide (TPR) repeat protein
MLRRTLAAILSSVVLSLALASAAHAQDDAPAAQAHAQADTTPAKAELNAGASAYKEGRFADAEQHFRRVLELDPAQKNVPLFIARSVQQQYKPGDASPENVATGERAVAAYQDILNGDPQNDDAFNAIVFLYGQMKRDDKVDETLNARANDPSVPNEKRAQVFVILASKQWNCSYDITERRENRKRDTKSGRVSYHMPADAADFERARQCADEGLRLVEEAVSLDPNSTSAWAYKANLLREQAKLAEMGGDAARKADYEKQYDEAFDAQKRATAEAQRKEREGQKVPAPDARPAPASTPEPAPDAPPEKKPMLSGARSQSTSSSAESA